MKMMANREIRKNGQRDSLPLAALLTSSFFLATLGLPALSQDTDQQAPLLGSATTEQVYTPVTPCRFVNGINADDRVTVTVPDGTTSRYYRVRGTTSTDFVSQGAAASAPSGCGIPTSATAVMVNLTVADPDADGDLKADPADVLAPSATSVLNYTFGGARGKNLANGVIVKLCDLTIGSCPSGANPTLPTRDIRVTFHAGASPVSTYFVADVLGYFSPAIGPTGPTGPTGPAGPTGPTGVVALRKFDGIFSGNLNITDIFPTACRTPTYTAGTGETALVNVSVSHAGSNSTGYLKTAIAFSVNAGAMSYAQGYYSLGPYGSFVAHVSSSVLLPLTAGSAYVFSVGVGSSVAQSTGVYSTCHITAMIVR